MSEWQPIETAPKDGTEILLLEPGEFSGRVKRRVVSGRWQASKYHTYGGFWCAESYDSLQSILATHWAPLPAPPA